eukprot:Amastigsp_a340895_27.p3 type:complete len:122 gc:universal Amastigsp_a340895_27:656-291(-)
MPRWPRSRGSTYDAPTSGNSPIAVSGIANTVRSVATRKWPWTESPNPPPIVIPSMSAMCGLGSVPIVKSSLYSSSKNASCTLPCVSIDLTIEATSPPAQNARSPAPRSTTAFTARFLTKPS